ncbi:Nuclear intron maturase 3, mitochondrial-like protein [Drosera capensis]
MGFSCFGVSGSKGGILVLPDLRLKIVIEALRMALEAVYDSGFATFAYGGRVGMGRHTAIRYLKNGVENPSWWFSVGFGNVRFDDVHVERLCDVIEERIDDRLLIGLIKRLFECNVLRIELGGCYLGRGLPQECALSAILINVYLNSFDEKIQGIRLRRNKENAKVEDEGEGGGFYKPVKIYAVRYLDEILVITSGSKVLTMDLMNWVVRYLEEKLDLKVDKLKTAIHSAVWEKINFLGMELQAVPPSVLRPPMSEKAKRARKKYLRQKEVKALELRNARETNRKKLGMKIFSHVFKKLKKSNNGLKHEYQIEDEVKEIFSTWAKEVMNEYLESLEERREFHRQLTSGDFLSLKRIRDQLPVELVNAYDEFQEQIDKYLNPVKAERALEDEKRRQEEEEEREYGKRTVEDLTKLRMRVAAPIEPVRKAVRLVGFTNKLGRPRPLKKHDATKLETIRHFTKDLKVLDSNGDEEIHFPTERIVSGTGDGGFADPKSVDGALTLALIRLAYDNPSLRCIAHFCEIEDTVLYRVRLLQKELKIDPCDNEKWVPGLGVIHESLHGKCIPLCASHISELYLGRITLQDIDCTRVVDVY